jgi:hypothetical protein
MEASMATPRSALRTSDAAELRSLLHLASHHVEGALLARGKAMGEGVKS